MTENFSTGDILQLQDTNCTKGMGSTLSTVLGIIGVIIVLALVWGFYTRSRDTRANTEAIASGALGSLTSAVNGTQEELRVLKSYERQDALKLAYTDGSLYGRPFHGHGGSCGQHRDNGDCCEPRQQFREKRQFTEASDVIELTTTCGSHA